MKSSELKRWLARQGCTFGTQRGSHLKIFYGGRQSVLPIHGKDLGPLAKAIKKQLGLEDRD